MSDHDRQEPKPAPITQDKYSGMRDFDFALSPNVFICAGAGAVLGLILAMWVTSDIGIVAATVIVFSVLSGIFGMFV